MKNITFISFYSDINNTNYYKSSCLNLQKQLLNLNIPFYHEQLENKGNYLKNCLFKPKFILNSLIKLNTPVFWIDADSKIINFPLELTNFDTEYKKYDLGFVIKSDKKVPESALIYFNNTEKSKLFLNEWIKRSEEASINQNSLDHPLLMDIFLEKKSILNYKYFNHDVCRVNGNHIRLIMSKEKGKRELEAHVINERKKNKKIW